MSKTWAYYCRDCNAKTDYMLKNEEALSEYAAAFRCLRENLRPLGWVYIDSMTSYTFDMLDFLEVHSKHDICLLSLYDDIEELDDLQYAYFA